MKFTTTLDYPDGFNYSSLPVLGFNDKSGLPLVGDLVRVQGTQEAFVVSEREWVVTKEETNLIVRLAIKAKD